MIVTNCIQIESTATKIYETIINFDDYSLWNPWIANASKIENRKDHIAVKVLLNNKLKPFEHKIIIQNPPTDFGWCDIGFYTHFAYGTRKRKITAIDEKSCLYQVELSITGPFSFLAGLIYQKTLENGLNQETQALKKWVESLNHKPMEETTLNKKRD